MCGAVVLGWYVYAQGSAYVFQEREAGYFQVPVEQQLARRQPNCGVPATRSGGPIGKIEVVNLGLSVVVLEGDDAHALRLGAGRIPWTAQPGQAGNIAIAAHRDTFFRPLRNIRQGDFIRLITSAASYTYSVQWTKIVGPHDMEVTAATPGPTLTLITCYPFYYIGAAPNRFVVRAREIATGPGAEPDWCRASQAH
ncbi:MAG TPA: class D sortase [Candidatus Acidoferrales bacterium]|nr:class D sortase [Candidatus Acidoferrales bacterium]